MKTAYKGYLICRNELNGVQWIEKDSARICAVFSDEHARRIIDEHLSPSPSPACEKE